ncbi:hypothetical protein MSAN_01747500 [Mycena sanguinolenta]|uniref:T6SS Phospholipase effector Tle1-like catalytic domain-containing protein n=1 Tax=Mycena sanguinolenta TaxID=230812 RepID=A0A8H6XWD3_9AGAR|nr:hypothetical protein MSAN_01747500 [Mycena sanguinolenta]
MSIPSAGHILEPTDVIIVEPTDVFSGPLYQTRAGSETAVDLVASPSAKISFSSNEKDQHEYRPLTVFVPPRNMHRCLILCFEGTGDEFDADNSNIVQLVTALKKDDSTKQKVYYQSSSSKGATHLLTKISLMLDVAIARTHSSHVMSGYEFLMQNYTAGDRICIFGFSRGAYIARNLAGMIYKVGLLPVDNHQQIPFAYRIYARADATGLAQSNAFKKAFSNDVQIYFIGVWDTVASVRLIPKCPPLTASNTIVCTFRHAVSLDELRSKFKANSWNFPNDAERNLGTHTPPGTPAFKRKSPGPQHGFTLPIPEIRAMTESYDEDEQEKIEFEAAFAQRYRKTLPTDILEVAGCHTDIGGGSLGSDTARHSLARIPLRWMIRECFKANTGIIFDAQQLQELGLDPATLYPVVLRRAPPPRWQQMEKARKAGRPPQMMMIAPKGPRTRTNRKYKEHWSRNDQTREEWLKVGGLLVGLAALEIAVFALTPDTIFSLDKVVRTTVAGSCISTSTGLLFNFYVYLRFALASVEVFKHRVRDKYEVRANGSIDRIESYVFFALIAQAAYKLSPVMYLCWGLIWMGFGLAKALGWLVAGMKIAGTGFLSALEYGAVFDAAMIAAVEYQQRDILLRHRKGRKGVVI